MRKGGRLFILLGVALALVAALLAVVAFSGAFGSPEDDGEPAKATVVVAARDIPANTVLSADDIEVAQVDKEGVAPGSATSTGQVIGLAASGNLVKGQQIVSANLVAPGLTFDLANGHRAVALPVDRVNALGGMIRPDDRIDIIYSVRVNLARVVPSEPMEVRDTTEGYAKDDTLVLPPPPGPAAGQTYPYPGEPGSRFLVEDTAEGNPVTKIIVQNVRVVRVVAGDTTVTSDTNASAGGDDSGTPTAPEGAAAKLPDADLLVLEVDPQQAEVIKFLMDNHGQYQIALRPKDDDGTATTTGVSYEQLVNDYGLPVPKTVRLPGGGQ